MFNSTMIDKRHEVVTCDNMTMCDGQCTVYEPGLCSQHDIGHSGTPEYTGPSDIVFNNCFQINLQTFTSKHNSQSTDKQQV